MKHIYIFFLIPFFTVNAQNITVSVDLSRLTYTTAGMNIYHSGSEQTGVTNEGNGIFSYTFTGLSEGDVVEYQWMGYIDSGTPTSGAVSLVPKIGDGGIEEDLRRKYSATHTNESFNTDYSNWFNYKVTALASDYTSPTHYWGSLERTNTTYSIITLNATSGGTYKAWNNEYNWSRGHGTVDNGDNTYTLTLDPTTSLEYYWKEEVSGTSEDLTSCTGNNAIVNTDGQNYANRVHNAGESRTDTFDTCPSGTLSFIDNELGIIEIYPNPFLDRISVSTEEAIDFVHIYDLTGRIVQQATPNKANFSLNVSKLSKGVYLVKLNSGDREATTKLIK